jgi:hypothetical protein
MYCIRWRWEWITMEGVVAILQCPHLLKEVRSTPLDIYSYTTRIKFGTLCKYSSLPELFKSLEKVFSINVIWELPSKTVIYKSGSHLNEWTQCYLICWNRDSSAGIERGYGLDGWLSYPGRGKRLFSISQRPDQHWGPRSLLFSWASWTISPGIYRKEREADYSFTCSAEVKGGTIPSLRHTSSWRVAELSEQRDKFTVLPYLVCSR